MIVVEVMIMLVYRWLLVSIYFIFFTNSAIVCSRCGISMFETMILEIVSNRSPLENYSLTSNVLQVVP